MHSFTSLATLAVAVASVSAIAVPRASPPAGYATGYLEPYDTYHTRYMALGCNTKHNTDFFNNCCHPMLATETLATARQPECDPSNSSAASSTDSEDDQDCEDGSDTSSASTYAPTAAAPTSASTTDAPAPTPDGGAAAAEADPTTSSTTEEAPAPTSATPQPASSPTSSSSGQVTGGFATFFFQNGVAGACGTVHQDSDFIAAIDADRYGDTGERSALCGQQVAITNTNNGKSVTVTIADACPTCDNSNSIDLSKAAFDTIADESLGIVPIAWSFS